MKKSTAPKTMSANRPTPTIVIPCKPQPRWIWCHENDIRRAFIGWAVSQHPFHKPPHVFEAMEEYVKMLSGSFAWHAGVIKLNPKRLRKLTVLFCHNNKQVARWNIPRKNRNVKFMFVSRYHQPKPEYDFVDLHALAGNIVRTLLKDEF